MGNTECIYTYYIYKLCGCSKMVKIRLPYMTPAAAKVQSISPKRASRNESASKLLRAPKWQITHSQRNNDDDTISKMIFTTLNKSSKSSPSTKPSSSKISEKKPKVIKKVTKAINMDEKVVCGCGGYYSNKIYYGPYANSAR